MKIEGTFTEKEYIDQIIKLQDENARLSLENKILREQIGEENEKRTISMPESL